MQRRTFQRSLIAASLAATLARSRAATAGMNIKFGACDWTLRLAANPESLDLAKRIGLDGVQVDFGSEPGVDGRLPLFNHALQDSFLQKASDLGIAVPSLAMGVLNKIPLKSDAAARQWVLDGVAVAKRMKTRVVLLACFGAGDLRNDEPGIESVITRLKELAPRAEEGGVIYGIESWLKVPLLERILDAVKSPFIQVYYDVGNMDKEGEDYAAAIRRLGRERICEFHAKDYNDLYGRGNIKFASVRDAMRDIGFTEGWMHIEGTKIPNGIEPDIRHDLEHLRSVFG